MMKVWQLVCYISTALAEKMPRYNTLHIRRVYFTFCLVDCLFVCKRYICCDVSLHMSFGLCFCSIHGALVVARAIVRGV